MDFLPIFMNVRGASCLVVGGGEVAARKVRLLLEAGARIRLVSPVLCDEMSRLVAENDIHLRSQGFSESDLDEVTLVIAATDDKMVNQLVSSESKKRGLPVNVVDAPELCTFVVPSIIDRSPIVVAVSSGGASPVLARLLRSRLETVIPASYGMLAELVGGFRDRVKAKFASLSERRYFWENILQGPVAEMIFSGQHDSARRTLEQALECDEFLVKGQGEVYLVGAGPGDPDLLTFRALRLLQQADVVVYDRLVSDAILGLARRDADTIYVGKKRSDHSLPQEGINALLVRLAKEGKRVVRLKGGDPFIFGRGGEEIETLMAEGVPFQVVPGITAAAGAGAYAGIPLTHRDYSQSVTFVTGHLQDGSMDLNWAALAQPKQTVVVYMGLMGVDYLCRRLIAEGVSESMPIALVQQATTPNQRVLLGTLSTMPELLRQNDVRPPTLIVIGEVVSLHEKLAWFTPADDKGGNGIFF